jgi:hypothetical protein
MNATGSAAEAEFRELEESMWRAETRFDRAYLERVLHPDFFEFGRSGRVWTRDDTMTMEPREIEARFPLPDFAFHPIDADTVLVTYTSAVRHETWDQANRSSIWVRDAGTWRLRFHHATPANP